MIEARVEHTEPAKVAFVQMRGPYQEMPKAFETLYSWVGSQGLVPAGMPRAVFFTDPATTPEAETVWELQTPIAGDSPEVPADAQGRGVKTHPAADEACTTFRGPYEDIAPTYQSLAEWVAEHGYVLCGPPSETYMSDPATTAPADYLTEVRFPVCKA